MRKSPFASLSGSRFYRAMLIAFLPFCIPSQAQLLPSFGNSRTGTAGMQFLKTGIDARGMGMAGAVAATVNDATAMYWNPACITMLDSGMHYNLSLSHCSYFAGTALEQAGIVYKHKFHYWGFQLASFHTPQMKETTEFQPQGTGRTFGFSDILAGISYARVLTDNFSFGVSGKYVNESFIDVHTNNVLFDLGLFYNVHLRNTRFAAVVSNFGINIKPHGEVTILKLSGAEPTDNFSAFSAPSIFRLAIATDVFRKNAHVLTAGLQLNHPGDNNETFSLGFEYTYMNLMMLRTGYEFGADEKGWPSLGAGIRLPRRFGNFRFDYAWQYKQVFGNVQRITLIAGLK
jgi:hypothetical protein